LNYLQEKLKMSFSLNTNKKYSLQEQLELNLISSPKLSFQNDFMDEQGERALDHLGGIQYLALLLHENSSLIELELAGFRFIDAN
jgi:hypothetical protein